MILLSHHGRALQVHVRVTLLGEAGIVSYKKRKFTAIERIIVDFFAVDDEMNIQYSCVRSNETRSQIDHWQEQFAFIGISDSIA